MLQKRTLKKHWKIWWIRAFERHRCQNPKTIHALKKAKKCELLVLFLRAVRLGEDWLDDLTNLSFFYTTKVLLVYFVRLSPDLVCDPRTHISVLSSPERICDPGEPTGSLPVPVPLRAQQGRQEGVAVGGRGLFTNGRDAGITGSRYGNQNEAVPDNQDPIDKCKWNWGSRGPGFSWLAQRVLAKL